MKKLLNLILLTIVSVFFGQESQTINLEALFQAKPFAVINNETTQITINAIDSYTMNYRINVTVNSSEASHYNEIVVPYSKSEIISNLEAIIYDESGKVIKKLKKKDFNDINSSTANQILDHRYYYYSYVPAGYPYTIEYSFTEETENTIFLKNFQPVSYYNIPVKQASQTIINNTDIPLRSKLYNKNNSIKVQDLLPKSITYTIENQPAIIYEPYSPSLNQLYPKAVFTLDKFNLEGEQGSFSSWEEFGKWYHDKLLLPTQNLPLESQEEARRLVSNTDDIHKKIEILYNYLQEKVRYVNISLGIGGWKPMQASSVDQYKYGDCKALSNYMKTLLDAVEIDSDLTVIFSNDNQIEGFDESFPKMGGNHMILSIPNNDETIWLECTSQKTAYNYLGRSTYNRNVLVVNEEGGKIQKSKNYLPNENTEKLNFEGIISENGSLDFNLNTQYKGLQYEYFLYYEYLNDKEFKEKLHSKYTELTDLEILNASFQNNKTNAIFSNDVKGKSNKFGRKLGKDIIINALAVGKFSTNLSIDNNRIHPLEIDEAFYDEYTFEYQLPNNYTISELPKNINITNKYGNYSLEFYVDENKVKVERKLLQKNGIYPKEDYNNFVKFKNEIANADNTKLLITQSL